MKAQILGTASFLALAGAVAPAAAQSDLETVTVTGSHITTPGFTSPTPVTSVSAIDIEMRGATSVNDITYSMPQLAPSIFAQQVAGNPGQSQLNLRNLGATRTLILFNGRRVAPTSYDGSTDANIIPNSLIKSVNVVTGGASAQYGSDAVAGVIDFTLDTDYEGFKGSLQGGQSQYHDFNTLDATASLGAGFAGGKGHFLLSGEVFSDSGGNEGVQRRNSFNNGYALVPNPFYVAGQEAKFGPKQYIVEHAKQQQMTEGGVIPTGPLKGIMFGPGGTLGTMTYGSLVGPIPATYMVGGSGGDFSPYGQVGPVRGRESLFGYADYDITPDLNAWGQLIVIDSHSESDITPNFDNGTGAGATTINITRDNAYLLPAVASMMDANKITSFILGRNNLDLGFNGARGHYFDVMYAAGLKGKFLSTWTWDATAQFTKNSYEYDVIKDRIQNKWAQAIDVIANPAVNGVSGIATGAPVCRSALPANGGNTGCVPTNIMGMGTITPAGIAYFMGTNVNLWPQQAWDLSGDVQGVLLEDWAGDISIATGFDMRRLGVHGSADAITLAKGFKMVNTQPFIGHSQVVEGYVETDVPLLKGVPLAQEVGINAAGRYTSYSISGDVQTYKFGLNWTVNDEIRLRATMSHDIRAPTLNDMFAAPGATVGSFVNATTNQTQTITYASGGNPNLKPEVGNTITGGVVYSPEWFSGFTTSVDYWQIHLHGGITGGNLQGTVNDCQQNHIESACANIVFSQTVPGAIVSILVSSYNVSQIEEDGIDWEANYRFSASDIWDKLDGTISLHTVGTFLDQNNSYSSTNVRTNSAGTVSSPHYKIVFNTGYRNDKWALELDGRYVSKNRYNVSYVEGIDINTNHIGDRFYFNGSVEYTLNDNWKIFGNAQNLLNTIPPVAANGLIVPQGRTGAGAQIYDIIGRQWKVGFRFNF